jgi:hypothetical protein
LVTGTVKGLDEGGLVLSVNGSEVAVSSGATSVTLDSGLAAGTAYTVAVETQPTGETCSVSNGTGTMPASTVTNVLVSCAPVQKPIVGYFDSPTGVAVHANGNVFVAQYSGVAEMPRSNGTYGMPVAIGSGFFEPLAVAMGRNGRLYVLDANYIWTLLP